MRFVGLKCILPFLFFRSLLSRRENKTIAVQWYCNNWNKTTYCRAQILRTRAIYTQYCFGLELFACSALLNRVPQITGLDRHRLVVEETRNLYKLTCSAPVRHRVNRKRRVPLFLETGGGFPSADWSSNTPGGLYNRV